MSRANRHFISGHIWHITHRCHKQEFLLKFVKHRQCWLHWLFEAKKRYGLCILNYIVTSNHIHLLVADKGNNEIVKSMRLIAGCTAQNYNRNKKRKGAFWEDRYHATAIGAETHLARCMTYIDLNMVRAGVVTHPQAWRWSGYVEIQNPPKRYSLIDRQTLTKIFDTKDYTDFQQMHEQWIEQALLNNDMSHQPAWSHDIAVGDREYIRKVQTELGIKARFRQEVNEGDYYRLKESMVSYTADFEGKSNV